MSPQQRRSGGRQSAPAEEAPRNVTSIDVIRKEVYAPNRQEQLLGLLGEAVDLDRFLTVALNAINGRPELLECTPESIVEAIRDSATLKLEPSGLMGQAYLVPYWGKDGRGRRVRKAKFQVGYKGLLELVRRGGEVKIVDAQVVYRNDPVYDVRLGTEPHIDHVPSIDGDRGEFRAVYAWARMASGETKVEPMTLADVDKIRASSQAKGDDAPWVTWPEMMMRKSALKRLTNQLPISLDHPATRALMIEAAGDQEALPAPRRVAQIGPGMTARQRLLARATPARNGDASQGGQAGAQGDDTNGGDPESDPGAGERADGTHPDAPGNAGGARGKESGAAQPAQVVLCGKPGLHEGATCVLEPHAKDVPHRDARGEEWI